MGVQVSRLKVSRPEESSYGSWPWGQAPDAHRAGSLPVRVRRSAQAICAGQCPSWLPCRVASATGADLAEFADRPAVGWSDVQWCRYGTGTGAPGLP